MRKKIIKFIDDLLWMLWPRSRKELLVGCIYMVLFGAFLGWMHHSSNPETAAGIYIFLPMAALLAIPCGWILGEVALFSSFFVALYIF